MPKVKKISINSFERIMKEMYTSTKTFDWHGIEVTVKPTLSAKEMLEFVDRATKSCFTKDDGTYMPEVKEFAIKSCVLEMYANFNMPSNIEQQYDLVYKTNAFECVLEHINRTQFVEIVTAIDDKISNIASANIEAINKQMTELYAALDNIQSQFANIFSGIEGEDMKKMFAALSDGGLDESKLVKAYLSHTKNGGEE